MVIISEGYIAALPESRCCHGTSVTLVTVIRMTGLHDSRQPPLLGHAYRIAQGWGMHDNGAIDVFLTMDYFLKNVNDDQAALEVLEQAYDLSSLDLVDLSPVVEARNQLATGFSALHDIRNARLEARSTALAAAKAFNEALSAPTPHEAARKAYNAVLIDRLTGSVPDKVRGEVSFPQHRYTPNAGLYAVRWIGANGTIIGISKLVLQK